MPPNTEISTEEKIKEAGRMIFTKKGFLATTIRDIAAEAQINVASVNYYFRSKENLFAFIMDEAIKKLFDKIEPVLNDQATSVHEKIEICVGYYIDQVVQNPDFVFFMVSEVMGGQTKLPMIGTLKILVNSHFAQQLKALQTEGKIDYKPVHLLWNIFGMIMFPLLSRPHLLREGYFSSEEFFSMMQERKRLIPVWMKQIIGE
ncbi:TetR/AcrR family transcriptional regulator [Mucilaginibacter sp. CAU 1740]|uniref:TetR/AcrR family transcriptional regulator n=1 Tax=Mucilaginibacter sp. CAU 1740 TaxID=3140365 RepID=UPI00325AF0F1